MTKSLHSRILGRAVREARKRITRINDEHRRFISRSRNALGLRSQKVFCIGRNKTGTTSLAAALRMLGYRVGDQRAAEKLMEDWGRRDFRRLIKLVHTADAFQDLPFSAAYTFQAMDIAFPGSKFILTIRDSPEQWYQSLQAFTMKRLHLKRPYTPDDLKNDAYVRHGWSWRNRELVWGQNAERSVWDEDLQKQHYTEHNRQVEGYFMHRPNDLLILNVAQADAMEVLCQFLSVPFNGQRMPRQNVTESRMVPGEPGSRLARTEVLGSE